MQGILTKAGINLFPDEDAFCYCESMCGKTLYSFTKILKKPTLTAGRNNKFDSFIGACEKNKIMEAHLYNCMAHMGLTHGFSWSRWNIMQSSRSAVLLMRELIEHRKTVPQITNLNTVRVNSYSI